MTSQHRSIARDMKLAEKASRETVARHSLPADFFDFAQVDAAAPEGAIVEVPLGK